MTEAEKAQKLMIENKNAIMKDDKVYCTVEFGRQFINTHKIGDYDTAYQITVSEDNLNFLYNDGSSRVAYGEF